MKKLISLIIIIMMVLSAVSCRSSGLVENTGDSSGKQSECGTDTPEPGEWYFVLDGVRVDLLKALPENIPSPDRIYEIDSCASQGKDNVYVYGSVQITLYSNRGVEIPYNIEFFDDGVSTVEGVRIGSSYDDMIAAYGSDFAKSNTMYDYVNGDVTLSFKIEDGIVTSILYQAEVKF